MPDPRKQLQEELRRGRQAFYGRLAGDAGDAAARLEQAYDRTLTGLKREIAAFDRWTATDEQTALMYARDDMRARLERELADLQSALVDVSAQAQRSGVEQGVRAGVAALQRGGVSVTFHLPTVETIRAGIGYVDSAAWRTAVGKLASYHAEQAADLVLSAIAAGVNPRETAKLLRDYFVTSRRPMVDALRMARTTQLYAAREGTRQIFERTGVSEWIWSANLGNPRTCLACVCLHGTVHPVSEVLNDHHNGRCAPIPVTPRWAELGLAGGRELAIETGTDWFRRLPAEQQVGIMGPRYYEAWTAGAFRLEQVPRLYHNDIFGPMYRKSTLAELLGGDGGSLPLPPAPNNPPPARSERGYGGPQA